jgi:hypothetical protein
MAVLKQVRRLQSNDYALGQLWVEGLLFPMVSNGVGLDAGAGSRRPCPF